MAKQSSIARMEARLRTLAERAAEIPDADASIVPDLYRAHERALERLEKYEAELNEIGAGHMKRAAFVFLVDARELEPGLCEPTFLRVRRR